MSRLLDERRQVMMCLTKVSETMFAKENDCSAGKCRNQQLCIIPQISNSDTIVPMTLPFGDCANRGMWRLDVTSDVRYSS